MKSVNVRKKLERCPMGTKLYSAIHGNVCLKEVRKNMSFPIIVIGKHITRGYIEEPMDMYGKLNLGYPGECILFPREDMRDWNLFHYALEDEYVTLVYTTSQPFKTNKIIYKVEKRGIVGFEDYVKCNEYVILMQEDSVGTLKCIRPSTKKEQKILQSI